MVLSSNSQEQGFFAKKMKHEAGTTENENMQKTMLSQFGVHWNRKKWANGETEKRNPKPSTFALHISICGCLGQPGTKGAICRRDVTQCWWRGCLFWSCGTYVSLSTSCTILRRSMTSHTTSNSFAFRVLLSEKRSCRLGSLHWKLHLRTRNARDLAWTATSWRSNGWNVYWATLSSSRSVLLEAPHQLL